MEEGGGQGGGGSSIFIVFLSIRAVALLATAEGID